MLRSRDVYDRGDAAPQAVVRASLIHFAASEKFPVVAQHGFDEPIHHVFGRRTEERGIGEQRLVALAIQTCDVADWMLRRGRTLITDTRILFARRSGIGCGTQTRMQISARTRDDAIGIARWKRKAISCRFAAYSHRAAVA